MDLPALIAARKSLLEARVNGMRRYKDSNGEEIEYKSDSEMRNALAALDAEIARLQRGQRSTFTFRTSKGL
ncbi:MAG: hypothetical protein DI568_15215 [Sphingomonas sp.]|nr:MAG: hypothetical protein DI568_15215 [Sphingomonas sp.]